MNDSDIHTSLPGWAVMWGLALAIYFALKLVSLITRKVAPDWNWHHLAYLFAWPGMDADAFLATRSRAARPTTTEWCFAGLKLLTGLGTLFVLVPSIATWDSVWIAWTGMAGIVLTLHFGLFHLLSCLWRSFGLAAAPIMNWPVNAAGLSDFWGHRWNMAFRDLTYRFLFRPLHRLTGPMGALLIGFLASGLIHDLVISAPANGGYGLPTCYFSLQGIGVVIEKSAFGRSIGLGRGICGRLYGLIVLLLPCGMLLHGPFACRIVIPFLHAIGALS